MQKTPYYTVREHHKDIFKTDSPISLNQLIFVTEAPPNLSGINIWDYVERVPTRELSLYHHANTANWEKEVNAYKLTIEEITWYPYYELFLRLNRGQLDSPLIFKEEKDGQLLILEGKHRLRILLLLFIVKNIWKEIPCLVVEETGIVKEEDCDTDLGFKPWIQHIKEAKETFSEFIRKE